MKVVIDGNIGSGKTTQLDLLEKKGHLVVREPIDQWPLDDFYKDPKRWGFYFQMAVLKSLRPVKTTRPVIYERCLMSSKWVFWANMVKKGIVTKGEDILYSKFYSEYAWYPDLYIYLSKNLDIAWEHIQARNQAGDSGVTREYLEELDGHYKKMILNVPCKIHVINANKSVDEIHKEICDILVENELLVSNAQRNKMQKKGCGGWKMFNSSISSMCYMS